MPIFGSSSSAANKDMQGFNGHTFSASRRNREAGLPKFMLLRPLGCNFNCYYRVKIQQSKTPRCI